MLLIALPGIGAGFARIAHELGGHGHAETDHAHIEGQVVGHSAHHMTHTEATHLTAHDAEHETTGGASCHPISLVLLLSSTGAFLIFSAIAAAMNRDHQHGAACRVPLGRRILPRIVSGIVAAALAVVGPCPLHMDAIEDGLLAEISALALLALPLPFEFWALQAAERPKVLV